MKSSEYIKRAERDLFHLYNRYDKVFSKGKGVHLYDMDDESYLDFASGIGVMAFGYGDRDFSFALSYQVNTLLHTSNLFYPEPVAEAAAAVSSASGIEGAKVFFTNSGAEAVEGALKTAKKYGYLRDGHSDHEIIAMNSSFHGRTVGALSVTGTTKYREPFYPLMGGVRFADFNDIESVKRVLTDKTVAIIVEPVQGEGGIVPADEAFLEGLRELCDRRDMLLIFDEIQCGMGRCGSMYAWHEYGVAPDIMTTAKALGGGIPVGAFVVSEKVADNSMKPGDHGSTYGGNPLALRAVTTSIAMLEEKEIIRHVKELTPYFEGQLNSFAEKYEFVLMRRGRGFMQGLVLDSRVAAGDIVKAALDRGLILLTAGGNVIRFLPPLVMDANGIDEMYSILDGIFKEVSEGFDSGTGDSIVIKKDGGRSEKSDPLSGRRILLCEDMPINAEITKELLLMRQVVVDYAKNGKEAVDMFSSSKDGYYDAVLMDVRMPLMNGLDATKAIRALGRADAAKVPIIALTTNAFEEDVQSSLDAGMNAHLTKPVDALALYFELEKYF